MSLALEPQRGLGLGGLGWGAASLGLHIGVIALFLSGTVQPAPLQASGGGGEEMSAVEAVLAQAIFPSWSRRWSLSLSRRQRWRCRTLWWWQKSP